MFYNANGGAMTIANGATASNAIECGSAYSMTIYGPAALTGNVNVQVSRDGVTFVDLVVQGSKVFVPAIVATPLVGIGSKFMRLFSDAAEGAARVFNTTLQEQGSRA